MQVNRHTFALKYDLS